MTARWHREVALAIGLFCLPATAAELGERRVTLGGFGTLGAVYHDAEDREYRRSSGQGRGAEAGEIDFETDSLIGLQLNAAWNQQFETVLQAVSRSDEHGSWRPRLTRGFLRWNPDPSLMLRAGRIGHELLPRADSRDIGYSYLPIRPPLEVFGVLPRDEVEGVDITYTREIGEGLGRAKIFGGKMDGRVVYADGSQGDLSGSKLWGGLLEYLYEGWAVRIGSGVFLAGQEPPVDPLVAALRQAGTPESQELANELDEKERRTLFTVFGVAYDEAPWQLRLFLIQADGEHAPAPKLRFGTLLAGYSLGRVTPYASFSAIDSYADVRGTGLPDTPQFAPLNAAARDVQTRSQPQQHSLALGVRYDLAPKVDLKFQVDQVRLRGSPLVFDHHSPPDDYGDMTVFGLALDFIF